MSMVYQLQEAIKKTELSIEKSSEDNGKELAELTFKILENQNKLKQLKEEYINIEKSLINNKENEDENNTNEDENNINEDENNANELVLDKVLKNKE